MGSDGTFIHRHFGSSTGQGIRESLVGIRTQALGDEWLATLIAGEGAVINVQLAVLLPAVWARKIVTLWHGRHPSEQGLHCYATPPQLDLILILLSKRGPLVEGFFHEICGLHELAAVARHPHSFAGHLSGGILARGGM